MIRVIIKMTMIFSKGDLKMVDQAITKQELINAKVDAKTLEDTVNGPPDIKVTSRLGRQYWTLATIDSKVASVVSQADYALVLIQGAQDQIVEIADTAQAQFDVKMADLEGQANDAINEWQAAINTIVINDGVPALSVSTATGQDQQEINDFGGAKWRDKAGGYKLGATVTLDNGDIVKSTVANNIINPNVDMTGWINPELEQQGFNDDVEVRAFANYRDIRSLNIEPSELDQTQGVIDALSALSAAGVRDTIYIPKGVKFSAKTVFNNLPVGIVLKISDFTNFGQSGYKNKLDITFSNDLEVDDTQTIQGSSHHAALILLNTGTGGTVSASERLASILHSVGISENGDPITAQIMQFRKAGGADERWAWTLRALIGYRIAMKDPVLWVSGKVYAAGDMCLSDGGKVYVTTLGGTSGATAPTGASTTINDGGVVWDYFAARKSKDTTTFIHYEDGNTQISGSDAEISFTILNGVNRGRFYVTNTGDVVLRDQTRGRNIITSSEARGIHSDGVSSIRFSNISGPTPTLTLSGARVVNAAAVTMTALNLPSGQTNGICYLHFADANTTLRHSSSFQLKGGVDVTPPLNGFMTFVRNSALGGAWYEVSRSF